MSCASHHARGRPSAQSALQENFRTAVERRFPRIPAGEAKRLARYACARGSDRVGALSGADGYIDHAVELAVIAHIRHHFTDYHALLNDGIDRDLAREMVRTKLERYLRSWDRPPL